MVVVIVLNKFYNPESDLFLRLTFSIFWNSMSFNHQKCKLLLENWDHTEFYKILPKIILE
jgi:hypothetical protein